MSTTLRTRGRPRTKRSADTLAGWALVTPSLVGVTVFLLVPILVTCWLVFQDWDGISDVKFVGFKNFQTVFTDGIFLHSLLVTLLFVVIVIPLQTAIGLFLAVLLTRALPGRTVFRTILVLPWVSAPLALGVVWKWIFQPTGGLITVITGQRIDWLTTPSLALPVIIIVTVWSQVGYVSLFFMSALSGIDKSVLEASMLDGANAWQTFWRIKLPLIQPTMFFVLVTSIIASFQSFDIVYAIFPGPSGSPGRAADLVATRIQTEAFQTWHVGRASLMALVLFVILVAVTLAQQLYFRKRITYDQS